MHACMHAYKHACIHAYMHVPPPPKYDAAMQPDIHAKQNKFQNKLQRHKINEQNKFQNKF